MLLCEREGADKRRWVGRSGGRRERGRGRCSRYKRLLLMEGETKKRQEKCGEGVLVVQNEEMKSARLFVALFLDAVVIRVAGRLKW